MHLLERRDTVLVVQKQRRGTERRAVGIEAVVTLEKRIFGVDEKVHRDGVEPGDTRNFKQ